MADKKAQTDSGTAAAPSPSAPDRSSRWLRYGANVTALVLAVVAIVVMVNWISYDHYVRLDFTASGIYSLSPQTRKLLDAADRPIDFTALYAEGSADAQLLERVLDLLSEYERHSDRITFRRIDPARNPAAAVDFVRSVRSRYQDEIDRNRDALRRGGEAMIAVEQFAEEQRGAITEAMSRLEATDRPVAALLQQLAQLVPFRTAAVPDIRAQFEQTLRAIDDPAAARKERAAASGEAAPAADAPPSMVDELPDFTIPRNMANAALGGMQDLAVQAIESFNRVIDDRTAGFSSAIKDAMLGLRTRYEQLRDQIDPALQAIEAVTAGEYDEFRRGILSANSLVVTTSPAAEESAADLPRRGVAVLAFTEIYPSLILSRAGGDVAAGEGYKGEEVITGAIVGLTSRHNTRVVFVNPNPQPMLGGGDPRISFVVVAERLRKLNFKVEEWQTGGSMMMGQFMPPGPKPVAEPGETMILVVVPPPPMNPQQPQMMAAGSTAATALAEHVAAGLPALVFVEPASPLASMTDSTELDSALGSYGIHPLKTQGILTHVQGGREGERRPSSQIVLEDWPRDNPVAAAMRGLGGVIVAGVPIEVPAAPTDGTTYLKLIETPADTWADNEYFSPDRAKRDDTDTPGPLTVGVAAERDGRRIAVIGDRFFSCDYLVNQGPRDLMSGRLVYTAFPANAELFVNTVYWLAGLEELIGPGAASRDLRRIEAVERPTMVLLWWLVVGAMPALGLAAGGVVYFFRRG